MAASAPPILGFKFSRSLTATGSGDAAAVVCSPGKSRGGAVQLSGTFVGTVSFEQSIDGGNTWIAKTVYPAAGGAGVTSATATGQWKITFGGETHFRARCSAYTSGAIVVDVVLTAGVDTDVTGSGTAGSPSGGVQSVQEPEDGATLTKASVTMTGSSAQLVAASASRLVVIVSSAASNAAAAVDPTGGTAALDAGLPLSGGGMLIFTGKQAQSAMTQIGTNTQKLTVYTG